MEDHQPVRGKVLIADDNDDSRTMLAFLLGSEGWEILEACNGREVLEKVVREKPDVLLLDNRMPELTGEMVYQQLQKQNLNLPVVLITAYSDLEELASSLGIRFFLKKPIDFPQLLDLIEAAYSQSKG